MARTKTVFGSHAQLAHVWAQQNTPEGYSSDRRMFFEGPTLYSYGRHYAIATFSKDKHGNPIVLFNSAGYSVSTGKHTSLARGAVSHLPRLSLQNPTGNPQGAIDGIDRAFESILKEYGATKHGGRKAKLLRQMEGLLSERNTIGEKLIKRYRVKALPKDLAKQAIKLVAADKAKAETAEAKRRADIEATIAQAEKALGATRDAWPAMWRANFMPPLTYEAEEASAWRRAIHYITYDCDTILLRLKGNDIETSRGAEFPVGTALQALPVIRRMKKQGKSWQRNGETLPLGSFQIDTIYPDGNVKAGCHLVTYAEIERMAKELGQ